MKVLSSILSLSLLFMSVTAFADNIQTSKYINITSYDTSSSIDTSLKKDNKLSDAFDNAPNSYFAFSLKNDTTTININFPRSVINGFKITSNKSSRANYHLAVKIYNNNQELPSTSCVTTEGEENNHHVAQCLFKNHVVGNKILLIFSGYNQYSSLDVLYDIKLLGTAITTKNFVDTQGNKYEKAIQYAQQQGVIDGYDDNTFRPDQKINRAEFTKIIVLSRVSQNQVTPYASVSPSFYDVMTNEWFKQYVQYALKNRWIKGYNDGSFRPNKNINFVEALKIITNAFGIKVPASNASSIDWYADYAQYASENNLFPPTITSYSQEITRGEMAELITRFLKKEQGTLDEYLSESK